MRMRFATITFALLIPLVCIAGDMPQFSARVSVGVSADENIKGKIESYIARELRSLGDVIVTNDNPNWAIDIVALEAETRSGYKNGVNLSVVITKPFVNTFLVNQLDENYKSWVSAATTGLCRIYAEWLRIGSPEDLRSICNGIVADFDVHFLQPERKSWQEFADFLKTNKPKKKTR